MSLFHSTELFDDKTSLHFRRLETKERRYLSPEREKTNTHTPQEVHNPKWYGGIRRNELKILSEKLIFK